MGEYVWYLPARSAVVLTQPEVEWVVEVVLIFSLLHSSLVRELKKKSIDNPFKEFWGWTWHWKGYPRLDSLCCPFSKLTFDMFASFSGSFHLWMSEESDKVKRSEDFLSSECILLIQSKGAYLFYSGCTTKSSHNGSRGLFSGFAGCAFMYGPCHWLRLKGMDPKALTFQRQTHGFPLRAYTFCNVIELK